MPSYVLKKGLVFCRKNEKDTFFRARSAGRIKTHQSYTDLRAWSLECQENRQYFLDIIYHAGFPMKAPTPFVDTTTTIDKLGSKNEDEEKADNKLQQVETKSQSQQCDFSENEENVIEEALQILESAKKLLSESLDVGNGCQQFCCNTETRRCSDYSKKEKLSRERSQILDNLRRENDRLQLRLTRLQKASPGMHKETELECLQQMVNHLEQRVRNLEEGHGESSEELDCKLKKRIDEIRNENSLVLDYLNFSERLSNRLLSVQSKYLDLAKDRNILRKVADSLETTPSTSQEGLSCLKTLRKNWEMAKSKVKDFGDFKTVWRKELISNEK